MSREWYPQADATFERVSRFTAYVAASNQDGWSASGWEVEDIEHALPIVNDVLISKCDDSNAQRAQLGAAAGAIQSVPSGSTLRIISNSQYLKDALTNLRDWKAAAWETADGPRPNQEILESLLVVLNQRDITVEAVRLSTAEDRKRANRLKLKVRAALRARIK